jgi:hypothetical protein
VLTLLFAIFLDNVAGQDEMLTNTSPNERRIIEQAKKEIINELTGGDLLQRQIEIGIQEYFKKLRQAQIAVQAEQRRQLNEKIRNIRGVSLHAITCTVILRHPYRWWSIPITNARSVKASMQQRKI